MRVAMLATKALRNTSKLHTRHPLQCLFHTSFLTPKSDDTTSTSTSTSTSNVNPATVKHCRAQRVWKCSPFDVDDNPTCDIHISPESCNTLPPAVQSCWMHAIDNKTSDGVLATHDPNHMDDIQAQKNLKKSVQNILTQEKEGGRFSSRRLGVLREDPQDDMRLLIQNFTAPALASALRDREECLQHCAALLADHKLEELSELLQPFESQYVVKQREKNRSLDLTHGGFDTSALEMLRKVVMRMSRQVTRSHQRRASVVLPLCNVNGVPCIMFEKRSPRLRAHADEVCLPGGMVDGGDDKSIVSTSLREMQEEIGIEPDMVTVLGVLRCNWGEVAAITGIAVTPVVCFIGEFVDEDFAASNNNKEGVGNNLHLNGDEVAECFTVPLRSFLDRSRWLYHEDSAPIFTGGPYIIWGLTGYIVDRFVKDVLRRFTVIVPKSNE